MKKMRFLAILDRLSGGAVGSNEPIESRMGGPHTYASQLAETRHETQRIRFLVYATLHNLVLFLWFFFHSIFC